MAKLEIKNITKKFGDFYAANNITFTAEEGEFVAMALKADRVVTL